jgi:hypothetical protein
MKGGAHVTTMEEQHSQLLPFLAALAWRQRHQHPPLPFYVLVPETGKVMCAETLVPLQLACAD